MKKILLIAIVILCSCSNKPDLELKILNSEVLCLSNINVDSIYENLNYSNKIYSQSRNIISYTIKNNSNKKYLIVANDEYIETDGNYILKDNLYEDGYVFFDFGTGRFSFNIYKGDSLTPKGITRLFRGLHRTNNYDDYEVYTSKYIVDTMSFNRNLLLKKSNIKTFIPFVIYPSEVKRFRTIVHLPLKHSNYFSSGVSYSIIDDTTKNYTAGISILNNSEKIKEYLTEDQKKEIEENGYTIFDGVLESNKVPVKLIPFEDKKTKQQ